MEIIYRKNIYTLITVKKKKKTNTHIYIFFINTINKQIYNVHERRYVLCLQV